MKKIINSAHIIACYSLASCALFFLIFAIYSKLFVGRVLYFGTFDQRNNDYNNYFQALNFVLGITFFLLPVWLLISAINIVINKKSYSLNKFPYIIGVIGFIISTTLLLTDPFGLIKYLND
jgi:hypothetical protein